MACVMKPRTRILVGVGGTLVVASVLGAILAKNAFEEFLHREYCRSNLNRVALAMNQYAAEHDGKFPDTMMQLSGQLPRIEDGMAALICPRDKRFGGVRSVELAESSYVIVGGYEEQVPDPSQKRFEYSFTINGNCWSPEDSSPSYSKACGSLPLAYEREDLHGDGLRSVVFPGAITDRLPLSEILSRIEDASKMTLEEYVAKYSSKFN